MIKGGKKNNIRKGERKYKVTKILRDIREKVNRERKGEEGNLDKIVTSGKLITFLKVASGEPIEFEFPRLM